MRPNQQANWDTWLHYNPRSTNWLSDLQDVVLRFMQCFFVQQPAGALPPAFHYAPAGFPQGRGLPNETDEKNTELIISSEATYNVEDGGKRPMLIISRGPFGSGNTAMENFLGIDPADASGSTELYTDLWSGSIVCNCIAQTTSESERLACIVGTILRVYCTQLHKAGFFRIGAQVSISPPGDPGQILQGGSVGEYIMTSVTTACSWQVGWRIRPEALVVAGIDLVVQTLIRNLYGNLMNPAVLSEDGTLALTEGEGVQVQIGQWPIPEPD